MFRSKIRPPHTVSLALVIWACSDSAMPLLSCACLCNNSKWCLPSFVSPSSCTVLFLHCFLLNITVCTAAQLSGRTFERRAPFATTSFKKGGWVYFRGWAYWEITVPNAVSLCIVYKAHRLHSVIGDALLVNHEELMYL